MSWRLKADVSVIGAYAMSGVLATHILDCIALFCGPPATIRADQETASTCRAPAQRACEHGVVLRLSCQASRTRADFLSLLRAIQR